MFFLRSKRARRLAGCTALAVSAGMLLASPASAAAPAPRPTVEKPAPAASAPSKRAVPQSDAAPAARASAADPLPSRSDLDGDGKTDLFMRIGDELHTATTNSAGDEFFRDYDTSFVKDIIPLGDFERDGSGPEVLTVSKSGAVTLYGNATSSFGNYRWTGAGWNIYSKLFSPGDISGDGHADVLARTYSGELWVYTSTGNPYAPFHARKKIGNGWNAYDQLVGLGDSDGDGKGDFLARTPSGQLFYYGSTGNPGTVKPRKQVGQGWQQFNQIIGVDDDNGNGIPDLLARDDNGTLWEYFGTGKGYFTGRKQVGASGGWGGVGQFSGAGNVPSHGKEGLLARDKAGTLFWYSGYNAKLGKRYQISDTGGWAGSTIYEVNSLGRDANSDTLEIYQGKLYGGETSFGGGWGAINMIVGPGDLNGDGSGDFVARDRSGVLWLYRANQDGTALHARVKVGGGWGGYDRIVGSGDYTGDGLNDIVARAKDGSLYLHAGTGKAASPFKPRTRIGGGWNAFSKLVAPGDLNGDGKGDLLAVTSGGDVYRYSGTGVAGSPFKPKAKIGYGYQIYNGLY
ncbi:MULTISPECIES: FG-GAP repeat domain-containing protein [unclassified Streptomyces]|uniref:FG-GAP repeat domain-containing protein n=1 Tax=unclassified Streptomyces TaxID=2593676 RepID=UPI0016601B26|nr:MULTISPECIES: VCBS repeat-containing protein [unclassified Streptomyces]MBD0710749.1 hypothetical protein [Streptomyces sp. CBMA291]MBD0717060.1 hypothetical protein [Streptomyces sp. CBMA370]